MHTTQFNKIVKARLKQCQEVLTTKGAIYNPANDRFKSFNTAAHIRHESPVQALDGMMIKHYVSYREELDKMEADPSYVPSKKWVDEKIGDLINYNCLFEGLVEDRRQQLEDE